MIRLETSFHTVKGETCTGQKIGLGARVGAGSSANPLQSGAAFSGIPEKPVSAPDPARRAQRENSTLAMLPP